MDTPQAPAVPAGLDPAALRAFIDDTWDREIVPALCDYIAVPAKSPAFDADWAAHGHIDRVVEDAVRWARKRPIRGLSVEVIRLPGRTPVLWFDAPATRRDDGGTVLMYGHLDKQPEFSGWRAGLGPWTPVLRDGKLYGRGGADDGYAVYASLTAIEALDRQGVPRPRCVGLIETCEESGSYDLLPYVDALRDRLDRVALVVCLDSGAGNYEQLWMTTSLRGLVTGTLEVQVLDEGVHSGDSSGVVPSSFRILRHLLDRLEDSGTGRVVPSSFHCDIPAERAGQARAAARILGDEVWKRFPWSCGAEGGVVLPMATDPCEALLNRTWRPALSVTGADGLPPLASAGNVLRPRTAFKLSLRLPPLVDAGAAADELKRLLEQDAPYRARVLFQPDPGVAGGWNAPESAPWLIDALDAASRQYFDAPCGYIGQGGTIPLMNLLRQGFPAAQFMVCGVLGPKSNAHGPNEFLHVPYARRLTAAVAQAMAALPAGTQSDE
ncbi:M20 family metallopeptidase [Castellaniella sp.]|uniref:M20 family metallopeptidase n=1 Tax=Castellaniella sp. TaxID=1955812 RepID=UPI002D7E6906|nr:M20 family metallopeptidase [Castellaniella sp.]HET8703841.1 M20 family metallopeptidase [Castellaniella sp.]